MDGERFDSLIKAISSKRLTRMGALRGMAAGAAAAVAGVTLVSGGTAAKKSDVSADIQYKLGKRKPICHCADQDPANCWTLRAHKRSRRKHLKHRCDYAGPCIPGRTGCPGPQPIEGCKSDADCRGVPGLPFCNLSNGQCVNCLGAGNCPTAAEGGFDADCASPTCINNTCGYSFVDAGETCEVDGECDGDGNCVPNGDHCTTDYDCKDPEYPICDEQEGKCVECEYDEDCCPDVHTAGIDSNCDLVCEYGVCVPNGGDDDDDDDAADDDDDDDAADDDDDDDAADDDDDDDAADDDDDDDDDEQECLAHGKVWCVSSIDPTRTKCCGNAQAICLTHSSGNVDCGTHAGQPKSTSTGVGSSDGRKSAGRKGKKRGGRKGHSRSKSNRRNN